MVRHRHPIARGEPPDPFTDRRDDSYQLVAQRDGTVRYLPPEYLGEIGAAQTTRPHLQEQLAGPDGRNWNLDELDESRSP
jgi:hypothetical protein